MSVKITIYELAIGSILSDRIANLTANGDDPVFWLCEVLIAVTDEGDGMNIPWHVKHYIVVSHSCVPNSFYRHLAWRIKEFSIPQYQVWGAVDTFSDSWCKVLRVSVCICLIRVSSYLGNIEVIFDIFVKTEVLPNFAITRVNTWWLRESAAGSV